MVAKHSGRPPADPRPALSPAADVGHTIDIYTKMPY